MAAPATTTVRMPCRMNGWPFHRARRVLRRHPRTEPSAAPHSPWVACLSLATVMLVAGDMPLVGHPAHGRSESSRSHARRIPSAAWANSTCPHPAQPTPRRSPPSLATAVAPPPAGALHPTSIGDGGEDQADEGLAAGHICCVDRSTITWRRNAASFRTRHAVAAEHTTVSRTDRTVPPYSANPGSRNALLLQNGANCAPSFGAGVPTFDPPTRPLRVDW